MAIKLTTLPSTYFFCNSLVYFVPIVHEVVIYLFILVNIITLTYKEKKMITIFNKMWLVAVSINAGFLFEQCIRAVAKKEIVISCPYFCNLNSLLVQLLNALSSCQIMWRLLR